jgi:hypothetical protein
VPVLVPVVVPVVVSPPPTPEVAPPEVVDPLLDPPVLGRSLVLSLEQATHRAKPISIGNNAVTEGRLFIELLMDGSDGRLAWAVRAGHRCAASKALDPATVASRIDELQGKWPGTVELGGCTR